MDEPAKMRGAAQIPAVAVPLDARQLGEFIASLLGQRRRLSCDFNVTFLVDWTWLRDLDQLVMQRVEHQNAGQLVDFSFKLFLSNGRITHITARSDFTGFRDISNVESVGVELVWTFLVKFPTSKNPEKQEISNYSRRVRQSRAGCRGRGLCQGVADGGESAPAVAAAGFDN